MCRRQPRADHKRPGRLPAAGKAATASPAPASAGVVRAHELALTREALGRLAEVPGLTTLGPARVTDRAGVISPSTDRRCRSL